jgi:hypothetical protein
MESRRQFLSKTAATLLGATGTALAFPGQGGQDPLADSNGREAMPDGSAARGMITPATESAIERGLAFLAGRQARDGSFGTVYYQANVAVTSLAGMAFMAGGHLPGRGSYGSTVARCLEFVLSIAGRPGRFGALHPDGFLHNAGGPHQHGPMYGHGFGTLFLAELYGMISDADLRRRLREVLPKAIQVILKAQNSEGGWRYNPQPRDADISVTICQIMALRSARNAGFYIPKAQVDRCVAYVKACQNPDGSFVYQRGNPRAFPGMHGAFARTAAGVCAMYSAGIYHDPRIDLGLDYLLNNRPGRFPMAADMHYFYGHYYAVQAMWTAGGRYWTEWFPAIRDELIMSSQQNGYWTDMICPHYATAMACIILQVPNNYLPILQK